MRKQAVDSPAPNGGGERAEASAGASAGSGPDPVRRILAVDDHPDILLLVELTLRRAGFEVETASHPGRVETLLDRKAFDAVILDLSLPEISGLEVLRRLRDSPRHRDLPVMILSAHGESADRVRGLREGANDYLAKPFEPEELLLRVKNLLADRPPAQAAVAPSGHQLSGSLEAYPLWDLLQSLERSNRSGRISIERAGRTIDLILRDGHLVHSEVSVRGNVSLVGEEAALVALSGTEGTFRFFDEVPRVPAEARPVDVAHLLMTAAWLSDEVANRAGHLPDWDEPIRLGDKSAVEIPPELLSPGGERVLGTLVAEANTTRRALHERGLAAPVTIDLLLATLAQHGALISLDPQASSRREQARALAAIDRLHGGSRGVVSTHILMLASAGAWHRFIARLGAWVSPVEGWWERLESIARERGGSIKLACPGGEVALHLLAFDAATLARAENVLPLCLGAGIWWGDGDDPKLAAGLIERSEQSPGFLSGVWIPIEPSSEKSGAAADPATAMLAGRERWRRAVDAPRNLSSFLESLL
ncbi:MAG TPA: response regulator [Thermoanaerobaculia bacterium]|nr:response regulator [Thermoanaerobaculia bacterium]